MASKTYILGRYARIKCLDGEVELKRDCSTISNLRENGWGWFSIARVLGLSPVPLKQWFRRNCGGE